MRRARGAGAPHGPQSGRGIQREWGHRHLQGSRGWRGPASPARVLFTVIHLGQLKPLFGRHNTQFPQPSSFPSSILLSRVVRASCPSESPCPHPEGSPASPLPLGWMQEGATAGSEWLAGRQTGRQGLGTPEPCTGTAPRRPASLQSARAGAWQGCIRLAAASAGPPDLMEI